MKKLTLIVAATLFFNGCSGRSYNITTESMSPTLKIDEVVFADESAYKNATPQHGDIVIVRAPDEEQDPQGQVQRFTKRVIGVGGDKIQIIANKLYINDQLFVLGDVFGSGRYFSTEPVPDFGPVVVPPNEFFLIGDNLPNSLDSRQWKHSTVTKDYIYGKVTTVKDTSSKQIRFL